MGTGLKLFDLLTHEAGITRELILQYAEKYCVCPFEMCLDVTTWADGVVCDYNYVFDPKAALKRMQVFSFDVSVTSFIFSPCFAKMRKVSSATVRVMVCGSMPSGYPGSTGGGLCATLQ